MSGEGSDSQDPDAIQLSRKEVLEICGSVIKDGLPQFAADIASATLALFADHISTNIRISSDSRMLEDAAKKTLTAVESCAREVSELIGNKDFWSNKMRLGK